MTLYDLKRYDLVDNNDLDGPGITMYMKETGDGQYIKYEDVRLLLVNLAGKIADQLIGI